jgi:hypothetical protein
MCCGCHLLFCAVFGLTLSVRAFAAAAPIRFAGQDAELVLSEVSERTLRIELIAVAHASRRADRAACRQLQPLE